MPLVDLLQRYGCLALIETCHEAPTLVVGHEALTTLLEVGIERGYVGPEIVERTIEQLLRDEEVLLYIVLLDRIACLTSEDDELADDILS